jgi:hypothetical protein
VPKLVAIGILSAFSLFLLETSVQAQSQEIWKQLNQQQQRRIREKYGGDMCYTILASSWRYYQRQRAAGQYSYPDAGNIRYQRKLEEKHGCPHLYNEDGTVNRVKGINDDYTSGSYSSPANNCAALMTQPQREECRKIEQNFTQQLNDWGKSIKENVTVPGAME